MRIGLVGNNDGPLILAKSMLLENLHPVCIGLQKPVGEPLKKQYGEVIDTLDFFSGFDEDELLKYLKNYDLNLLINCFCNFKFDELLERYEVLNVHLAPLPKYRGRHPMHWALINGESQFGVTIHHMDREFDSGAILWQKMLPVPSGMSVAELRQALIEILKREFGGFLIDFQNGEIKVLPNEDGKATFAPRRYPADSRLTEWHDRDLICRKVMALRSEKYPAFLQMGNHKIELLSANPEESHAASPPSASIHKIEPDGIQIRCLDGKIVGLYGFDPEKFGLEKNQKIA